jgi:hypothetical protein
MRLGATVIDNPWGEIPAPSAAEALNARRVDADLQWDFFWGKDVDNHCLLLLTYAEESRPTGHLPRVKGIDLRIAPTTDGHHEMLVYCLADAAQRDIFYKLCRDIVESSTSAADERDAVAIAVRRTWRWHHLLRGGSSGLLTAEEQKGLIGELLVLERYLLLKVTAADALQAWHGPLHAPKDFELAGLCIEAKARRGPAKPFVAISSEYQLDTDGLDALFLHVVELDRAAVETENAYTLTEVARRLFGAIIDADQAQTDTYESLLLAAGFAWSHDYSEFRWHEGPSRVYRVKDDFPRVEPSDLRGGVHDVKYRIALQDCAPFETKAEELLAAIGGGD